MTTHVRSLAILLASGGLVAATPGIASPAAALTYDVSTWAQLRAAFSAAGGPHVVVLHADAVG